MPLTALFHIALYEPEIPPNTGNIIRLCANTGSQLHLIRPLGFDLDDKKLRRAGLDYHEWATMRVHDSYQDFRHAIAGQRLFAITTKGHQRYTEPSFQSGDVFLFGPESRGLPREVLEDCSLEHRLRLPMQPDSRSLNLSNCCAVLAYEAWRQLGFPGAQ